jgi:CheY-like chemotaxis protein
MRKLNRALVADDNRIERVMLRAVLSQHGVEVVEAADGEKAIEILEGQVPDLIISDVLMPKLDGFALAAWLQKQKLDPAPVLFLTSAVYKTAHWKHEALTTYDAAEFLRKPLDPEMLLEALRRHFEVADAAAES